jgi:uncharacterized SAM-binding protein YcdF (DUF218 family)
MLFALSKFVGGLLRPPTLLLITLALALAWQRSRPRASRMLLIAAVLAVAGLHLAPGASWLVSPLENRFPQPALPEHVDGFIVLGGVIDTDASAATHQTELNESAGRITAAIALMHRYPDARMLFSGGAGLLFSQEHREADMAHDFLISLGVDTGHALFERNSRTTWENAVDSMEIAHPRQGETWLLVTSAWHMPRAVGCFRRAGWKVTPYPVDYRGAEVDQWFAFNGDEQLRIATLALKEWVGLVAYRLLDRTDAFFPSPTVPPLQ